jgi:hypothetical protein
LGNAAFPDPKLNIVTAGATVRRTRIDLLWWGLGSNVLIMRSTGETWAEIYCGKIELMKCRVPAHKTFNFGCAAYFGTRRSHERNLNFWIFWK